MQNTPPAAGSPRRPTPTTASSSPPPSTINTAPGLWHRVQRARMHRQLAQSLQQIGQLSARTPGIHLLRDAENLSMLGQVVPLNRSLIDRLNGFSRTLTADTADAKAARAVAMPLLLTQYKATCRFLPSYEWSVRHTGEDPARSLFDSLCRRTLAALDVRGNQANLACLLSQLEPAAIASCGDEAYAGLGHVLRELVVALAQPSLGKAHASQLLDFAIRPQPAGVPARWLAHAVSGLAEGYLATAGRWPQDVRMGHRLSQLITHLTREQLQALGRYGAPPGAPLTNLVGRTLGPSGQGFYARGVLQRLEDAKATAARLPNQAGDFPGRLDDVLGLIHELRLSRHVLLHALFSEPLALFAVACVLSRQLGQEQSLEIWDQVATVAEPAPDAAQAALFEQAIRLAWAPLTVLGESAPPLQDKLRRLALLDELVGVPLTAQGWLQIAAIHRIDADDADLFLAGRGEPFIRQVFAQERDAALEALQAAYAPSEDGKDTRESKSGGFAAHVPRVAPLLTRLLTTFDDYERRCAVRGAVPREFIEAQRAWVSDLPGEGAAWREIRAMVHDRLDAMGAPPTRREGKGEPDGDSGDAS